MGLTVSHGAFNSSYNAFNRFRQAVARSIGGSYPPHLRLPVGNVVILDEEDWYWGDNSSPETNPGLEIFFNHPDDHGELTPSECVLIADELESLLPEVENQGKGGGHIQRDGGYGAVTRRFIAGCREAAARYEPLVFQ